VSDDDEKVSDDDEKVSDDDEEEDHSEDVSGGGVATGSGNDRQSSIIIDGGNKRKRTVTQASGQQTRDGQETLKERNGDLVDTVPLPPPLQPIHVCSSSAKENGACGGGCGGVCGDDSDIAESIFERFEKDDEKELTTLQNVIALQNM
jgi:hypothetical protein